MQNNHSYYCYQLTDADPIVMRFRDPTPREHFAAAHGYVPASAAIVCAKLGIPRQCMIVYARHLWDAIETTHGPALRFNWNKYRECLKEW